MFRMARKGSTLVVQGSIWDMKPGVRREDYAEIFAADPIRARRDYEAIPPETVSAALHDQTAVERFIDPDLRDPILEDGGFATWWQPDPLAEYYLHGDLSKTRDATGLSLSHYDLNADQVVVDMMMRLVPSKTWSLSFERIVQIVLALKARGFNIVKVTFDGWQSLGTIERLTNAGINAEQYSADRSTEAYDTLIGLLLGRKLRYYRNDTFMREFRSLRLIDGKKYDHPEIDPETGEKGSKDLSDAVACSVAQCVKGRLGMSIGALDLEKQIHEEHLLTIVEDVSESHATFFRIEPQRIEPSEKARGRIVRLDLTGSDLLFLFGWFDQNEDRHYLDEFLIWQGFDSEVCVELETFVTDLATTLRLTAFSLGASVPFEVLSICQRTGRPVDTPLNVRVPDQHRHVAQASKVDAGLIRRCLDHLRRGNVSIPRCLPLQKDIRYSTDQTVEQRPYLGAFAAWWDFATREMQFGRAGKKLPAGALSAGGVGRSAVPRSPTSADPIERIRERVYTGERRPGGPQGETPGPRVLPRSRRM